MRKHKTVKAKLGFSLEVVLVVIVLLLLFRFSPLGQGVKLALPNKSAERTLPQNETSDLIVEPTITDMGEHFTPIEMAVIGTETLSQKMVTKYPVLPGDIAVFDQSKFVEGEVNEYAGGTEYFLTFEYPGKKDASGFKAFYENFAYENGWNLNLSMSAVNGIKTVLEKGNIEMRVVTFKKQNEAGEYFIREKVRIFLAK